MSLNETSDGPERTGSSKTPLTPYGLRIGRGNTPTLINTAKISVCEKCGEEYNLGDWPWCPHGNAIGGGFVIS